MTLPEISIRRYVLAWMISGIFVLLGFIGFQKIGIDKFPMVEFPILSVTTSLEGANPEIIDSSITNIIENAHAIPLWFFRVSRTEPAHSKVIY